MGSVHTHTKYLNTVQMCSAVLSIQYRVYSPRLLNKDIWFWLPDFPFLNWISSRHQINSLFQRRTFKCTLILFVCITNITIGHSALQRLRHCMYITYLARSLLSLCHQGHMSGVHRPLACLFMMGPRRLPPGLLPPGPTSTSWGLLVPPPPSPPTARLCLR